MLPKQIKYQVSTIKDKGAESTEETAVSSKADVSKNEKQLLDESTGILLESHQSNKTLQGTERKGMFPMVNVTRMRLIKKVIETK